MTKKIIAGITFGIIGAGAIALLAAKSRDFLERVLSDDKDEDWLDACRGCDVKGCMHRRGGVTTACKRAGLHCRGLRDMEREGEALSGGCKYKPSCGNSCGSCGGCENCTGTFPETDDEADWDDVSGIDLDDSDQVFEDDGDDDEEPQFIAEDGGEQGEGEGL